MLVVQKGRTNVHDEKQNGQVTIYSRKCSRILLMVLTLYKVIILHLMKFLVGQSLKSDSEKKDVVQAERLASNLVFLLIFTIQRINI